MTKKRKPYEPIQPWEVLGEAIGLVLSKGQVDWPLRNVRRDKNGRMLHVKVLLLGGYSVTFDIPKVNQYAK